MRRIVTLVVLVALSAASCGSGSTEGKLGRELFDETCASCHRSDGAGSSRFPAVGAGSDAALLSDEQLAGVIRAGPGAMPSFSRFSEEQVESLVAYMRLLQGGDG